LKAETRGIIEKAIDRLEFGFEDIEAFQEITPIKNMEEFLLGYSLGYLRRVSEVIVLMQEKNMTKTDDKEISKIILTRIPEIRKKLLQYLNK
jgi:hypothetical protein